MMGLDQRSLDVVQAVARTHEALIAKSGEFTADLAPPEVRAAVERISDGFGDLYQLVGKHAFADDIPSAFPPGHASAAREPAATPATPPSGGPPPGVRTR